jgi:DNA repair exonuclease SbcCD nuclease subunit
MRILFTADLHINLRQKKVPKKWALERYNILFDELDRIKEEEQIDIEIHGGDIFDKLPNLEELELYYSYLRNRRDCSLVVFDGNHEATKKGSTFLHVIKETIENQGGHTEVLGGPTTRYGCDFIPYTHIKSFNPGDFHSHILFTHVRGTIPPHVTPEIPLEKLSRWDTVFAGDLHSHTNSQGNIVYPGSPVSVTFHRNKIETGIIIIDLDDTSWKWEKIDVPQLYRKTVDNPDDMVKTEYDYTIYELVGNVADLQKKIETELLDKKIIQSNSKSTLDLANLTLRDELILYLTEIKHLDNIQINETMRIFDDYIQDTEMG